jgi:hypothetical protein
MAEPARIERVYVEAVLDQDPDISYLPQDYSDVTDPRERQSYLEADRLRKESFGEDWVMIGVRAVAEVVLEVEGMVPQTIRLTSGGIWGIESDSGRKYVLDTGRDQLPELREQLKSLRFPSEDIDAALVGIDLELVERDVTVTEPQPEFATEPRPEIAALGELDAAEVDAESADHPLDLSH